MFDIEADFGEPETLNRPPVNEVLGDDFIHIFELDKAVPDGLGIDHDHGAVLALVQTTGLIGADDVL